jgi:hypothetical protein
VATLPAGVALSLSYDGSPTPPTHVGTVTVVATSADADWSGSASAAFTIAPMPIAVIIESADLAQVVTGAPRLVRASSSTGAVVVTYDGSPTPPTRAGSYAIVATASALDAAGSATATLIVSLGTASVTLDALSAIADGQPHAVRATTVPAGLPVRVTYAGSTTPPSLAGTYAVIATISDPDWLGSASGVLIITAADASSSSSSGGGGSGGCSAGGSLALALGLWWMSRRRR